MAASFQAMRPSGSWKSIFRELRQQKQALPLPSRSISTAYSARPARVPLPKQLPEQFLSQIPQRNQPRTAPKKITVYPAPPSPAQSFKNPIGEITTDQLAVLDPTGARKALFDYRRNPQSAKVGDVLRVSFKSGDPFAGVCLNIRSRGIDTAFLLRNQLTRVGAEMWIKVFSPNVEGVEIVQRAAKRKRRARLYYMRQPKHDMGSVENIVRNYVKERAALTGGTGGKRQQGQKKKGRK